MAVGLAIGAGLQLYQMHYQRKAAKQQSKEMANLAALKRQRAEQASVAKAREAVRQHRAEVARATNAAYLSGVAKSSGLEGGIAGARSSLGHALSQTWDDYLAGISEINISQRLGTLQANQANLQVVGQIGASIFESQGGYRTLFGGNTGAPNISTPGAGGNIFTQNTRNYFSGFNDHMQGE